jgi:succinyl-diaminopimelate desuccinylase
MIEHVAGWLTAHGTPVSVLDSDVGRPVALVGAVNGAVPGPTYRLNAYLDTAPFGELTAWQSSPTDPRIADGWMYVAEPPIARSRWRYSTA